MKTSEFNLLSEVCVYFHSLELFLHLSFSDVMTLPSFFRFVETNQEAAVSFCIVVSKNKFLKMFIVLLQGLNTPQTIRWRGLGGGGGVVGVNVGLMRRWETGEQGVCGSDG